MVELPEALLFWHWWILGVALVTLEVLAPGVIFLWLGIGAGVTGLIVLVDPDIGWKIQLVMFAVLSVISGIGGRMWVARRPLETDHPKLNQRGEQYVGRSFTLDHPIENGVGKIKVDDSTWKVVGSDLPAGTKVNVTGTEGVSLKVEKA